jgi:hypothetical protein
MITQWRANRQRLNNCTKSWEKSHKAWCAAPLAFQASCENTRKSGENRNWHAPCNLQDISRRSRRNVMKKGNAMFTLNISTLRDALVSAAGSVLLSLVIVGAAVLPAQTATAAMLHL